MRQLLLIFLFMPFILLAQNHEMTGIVVDDNQLPVEGATIKLLPGKDQMFSNTQGQFIFKNSGIIAGK